MMMIKTNLVLILLLAVATAHCSFAPKSKPPQELSYPPELVPVDQKIKEEKYFEAHEQIDSYLNKSQNLSYFGVAYFLKGYVYELQGEKDKTIEFYRRAINHNSQFDSLIEAKALYNLSFTYERDNDFDSVMSVLTDLVKRPDYFQPLTAQVETRARMGAALASLGQMQKAKKYHREAEEAYYKMSRENFFKPSRLALTKALYYLGVVVYDAKYEQFDDLRDKLRWGQIHLLACTEASVGSWSRKAANRLLLAYDRMWQLLKNYQPTDQDLDPQARKKSKEYRQLEMASDFYDILRQIRPEEFPLTKVNRYSRIVVETSDKWMSVLQEFVQTLDMGPELIRDQIVKQRPLLVDVADDLTEAVASETKKSEPLPPPIGVQISSEIQQEMELENAGKSEQLAKELKSKMNFREDKDIAKEKDKKSKFIPLPEKDPNL